MQSLKHEIHEPWKSHFQAITQEIQRKEEEILVMRGAIAVKQQEQETLRKHAQYVVGQLVVEAKLPMAAEGAYSLSPDGCHLVGLVADPQPTKE